MGFQKQGLQNRFFLKKNREQIFAKSSVWSWNFAKIEEKWAWKTENGGHKNWY